MKKGQIVEGIIERVDFPNKGILVTEDGEKVVVKNTIKGQKVSCLINKIRHKKAEGRLLEVLEKSSDEIEPVCPHFGSCGGCTFLNLPYEKQIELKRSQVETILTEVVSEGACENWFEGIKGSPVSTEYRNKMEFTFGDEYKDGPLSLGMHKRGSFYDIVTVDECKLVHPDYRAILRYTLDYFKNLEASFFHRITHIGYLRHLLVRRGVMTGEILVDLVTTTQNNYDLTEYARGLCELELEGTIAGVLHTKNDSLADVVKDEGTEILYGQDYFYEKLLGLKFKITPFSFFQTNSKGAEVLYETAREYAMETGLHNNDSLRNMIDSEAGLHNNNMPIIFDLYSGTGTIAQMMAPVAKKVVGIEIIEEAVEAAKINAKLNGLDNCEFHAGDVLKVIDEIEDTPDLIILDPPRDGCHPKALSKIIAFGAENIVYISCKVTSLARDLLLLQEGGYHVVKAMAIDQFPNTGHVETVVLLNRQMSTTSIEIEMTAEDLELTRIESKATYKDIEMYVKNKYGLHVSNLYIAQVKAKHGIIERENYNKGSEGHRVPQCPSEKWDAIEDALRYFKMI